LKYFYKVLIKVTNIITYIASLIVAFIFVSVTLNIFFRSAGHSFYGLEELNGYLMPWICFLSIPIAVREHREIAIDLVYERFPQSIKSILDYFNSIISISLYIFITYWSIKLIMSSYQFSWRTVELAYPIWVLQLCLIIGFVLYALEKFFYMLYSKEQEYINDLEAGKNG
jgi:TRAP-type C4-dicarboxylate transport system permease small subunit